MSMSKHMVVNPLDINESIYQRFCLQYVKIMDRISINLNPILLAFGTSYGSAFLLRPAFIPQNKRQHSEMIRKWRCNFWSRIEKSQCKGLSTFPVNEIYVSVMISVKSKRKRSICEALLLQLFLKSTVGVPL